MKTKEIIILGVLLILGVGGMLFVLFYSPSYPLEESKSSTTLPLFSNEWKEIKVEQGTNSTTSVLELEHGWLVYRSNGFGGGMAFVPKPK